VRGRAGHIVLRVGITAAACNFTAKIIDIFNKNYWMAIEWRRKVIPKRL
jgi:hypothetical protein